jgi:SHS2 domain-containing protein
VIDLDARYVGDAAGDSGGDFQLLDVSGDVGLRVRAENLEALFVKAGLACSALMVDPRGVLDAVAMDIEAGAEDGTIEELLVAWLNELIYRFDAGGFTAGRITVLEFSPARIKTVVAGQYYDPRIHTPGLLVKAATHHGLKIIKTKGEYVADIVFDI